MKLRLRHNSLRLRLTRSDVARLIEVGCVEEVIEFGAKTEAGFVYKLELVADDVGITARYHQGNITVTLPHETAKRWAESDEVGFDVSQTLDSNRSLRIVIEKDFACLAPRIGEDESDAFPHPPENATH